MRFTVFGATGDIGRHILGQAVAAGHDVTAVACSPQDLSADVRAIPPTWPAIASSLPARWWCRTVLSISHPSCRGAR
jgi:nucleoside-diphosphate-sugar epimerase